MKKYLIFPNKPIKDIDFLGARVAPDDLSHQTTHPTIIEKIIEGLNRELAISNEHLSFINPRIPNWQVQSVSERQNIQIIHKNGQNIRSKQDPEQCRWQTEML